MLYLKNKDKPHNTYKTSINYIVVQGTPLDTNNKSTTKPTKYCVLIEIVLTNTYVQLLLHTFTKIYNHCSAADVNASVTTRAVKLRSNFASKPRARKRYHSWLSFVSTVRHQVAALHRCYRCRSRCQSRCRHASALAPAAFMLTATSSSGIPMAHARTVRHEPR